MLRATLYTSQTGSDGDREALRGQLREQTYTTNAIGRLPNRLFAEVFYREKNTERSNAVDIRMTVDALSHGFADNFDTALLMTGDGDFVPLVEQLQRVGKQVYVSAFSSGLNDRLRTLADEFYLLDNTAFA